MLKIEAGRLHPKYPYPGPSPRGSGEKRPMAYARISYLPVAVKKIPFSTTGSDTIRSQAAA